MYNKKNNFIKIKIQFYLQFNLVFYLINKKIF